MKGRALWFPLILVGLMLAAVATSYAVTTDGGMAALLHNLRVPKVVSRLVHGPTTSPVIAVPRTHVAGQSGSAPVAAQGSTASTSRKPNSVTLFFPDSNAEHLVAETRLIGSDAATPERVVEELFKGPTRQGSAPAIPKGGHLRSVSVSGGVATVDFAGDVRAAGGGSTAETMVIYSVVETVTALGDVKAVRFTVDGSPIDTLYGHLDLSTAVEPDPSLLKVP